MTYLLLKWLHILSATILFGAGIGSAFHLFMANRQNDVAVIHAAARHVVLADWLFTTPSVILQLATGLLLVREQGYALTECWIMGGLALYAFAGLCWLPVVWIQLQLRDLARDAQTNHAPLPPRYHRLYRWWIILGSLAFPAIVVVFYLMVFKPACPF